LLIKNLKIMNLKKLMLEQYQDTKYKDCKFKIKGDGYDFDGYIELPEKKFIVIKTEKNYSPIIIAIKSISIIIPLV
jgi:hypothetical protein